MAAVKAPGRARGSVAARVRRSHELHSCWKDLRVRKVITYYLTCVHLQATLEVGSDLADFPNYYKVRRISALPQFSVHCACRLNYLHLQVLRNQDGDAVTLSSFKGKKPVVLFFYPKAATPGCTAEACGFRDKYGQFTAAGAEVRIT